MRRGGWTLGCLAVVFWACGDASEKAEPGDVLPEVEDTAQPEVEVEDTDRPEVEVDDTDRPEVEVGVEVEDTALPEVEDTALPPDVAPTRCTIDGISYESGAVDPGNACQLCDLATPGAWTAVANGAACGTGRCLAGQCVEAPRVDGASPRCAANRGGDLVTVSGAHLAEGASATIAGLPAALSWLNDQSVTLTVPAAPALIGEVPLIVTNPDGQSGTSVAPFRLFGGIAFEPAQPLTFNRVPGRFAAGDVDGDGRDDLVFPLGPAIQVARLGGLSGFFGERSALTGCEPYALTVFEATGDALADVVAVCADGLKVYAGTADGLPTLVAGTPLTVAPARQLVAGHFNDDAVLDLAVVYFTGNEVGLFRGTGTGTFTAAGTLSLSSNPPWFDAGDLTGDGLDDLVFAHTEAGRLDIVLATASGTFAAPKTLSVALPGTVHVARIDADPLADLVVSSQDSDVSASWFRSQGDGTFAPRVNFTFGGLIGAAVGDFNEDGLGDAIVNSGAGIRVFPGNGDGTFDCTLTLPMNPAPHYLLVGDFDGNGRLDIAGRNPSLSTIYMVMQAAP